MILALALAGLIVLVSIVVWLTYNRMVDRRNAVDNSWAQVETALQRRHDLIPNLVGTVKGYAAHERRTLDDATSARSNALAAKTLPRQAAAEDTLTRAVGGVFVVAEQYPQLRATENFQELQASLSDAEDQIAITRRVYNDTVQTYNTLVQVFPALLVARAFGFRPREFFDAEPEAGVTPELSFPDRGAADTAPTGSPDA